jgi:hypothetical protein
VRIRVTYGHLPFFPKKLEIAGVSKKLSGDLTDLSALRVFLFDSTWYLLQLSTAPSIYARNSSDLEQDLAFLSLPTRFSFNIASAWYIAYSRVACHKLIAGRDGVIWRFPFLSFFPSLFSFLGLRRGMAVWTKRSSRPRCCFSAVSS